MRFGFPPFGFFFYGPGKFPSREEYLRMLEEYKRELEEELREVERQIEEMKRSK
jgi:hypothetical protein